MPVTIDKFEYATDALARAAWQTYENETYAFYKRVIADGGTVISLGAIDAALVHAKNNNYYSSLAALYGANFAYKLSGTSVTKVYDVSPNNLDLTGSSVSIASDGAFQLAAGKGTLLSASSVSLSALEYWAVSYWAGKTGDGNEHLHIGASSGGSMLGWASNKPRIGRSGIAWDYTYGSTHYGAYGLYGVRWDGSNHYLRINGAAIGSSPNAPQINAGFIRAGATTGSVLSKIKEILVLNSAAADRATIEAFKNSVYSIY